jgi:two-component system sensor histidine kinase PilS (NtrC family)
MNQATKPFERRKTDRRSRSRAARADESWFGAFMRDPDEIPAQDVGLTEENTSRFMAPTDKAVELEEHAAFQRTLRAFLSARAALGLALVLTLATAGVFGVMPNRAVVAVSVVYALLAIAMRLAPSSGAVDEPGAPQLSRFQWVACIGVDIAGFMALHVLSFASNLNYGALLVLPALMAGVLAARVQALATAAAVVLLLLGYGWLGVMAGGDPVKLLSQAGLAGSGLLVISLLASELANRLARQELSARDSMEFARQQGQLNRLVIEEMQDGVLVVDRSGRVRAANPAARRLLVRRGEGRMAPFQLRGVDDWSELVKTVERGFHEAVWPEAGRDVTLRFEQGASRTLRVRMRFTSGDAQPSTEELCVLLLEDVRSLQSRMRQEKLAAMGRVSAGIAHEIRNPLSAIGQANALLAEDAQTPQQRQLTRMVADNVKRLTRIVDDVMQVAPAAVIATEPIAVRAEVANICSEWARSNSIDIVEHSVLKVELPDEPLEAVFEAEHLRRVLVNLLDNARMHATDLPGAVHVRLSSLDEAMVQLSVSSDGALIPEEVERYLFEPFFSTRSRGSGLGLYICRQLCDQHGASIDYRLRPPSEPNRNDFFVNMRRRPVATAAAQTATGSV